MFNESQTDGTGSSGKIMQPHGEKKLDLVGSAVSAIQCDIIWLSHTTCIMERK